MPRNLEIAERLDVHRIVAACRRRRHAEDRLEAGGRSRPSGPVGPFETRRRIIALTARTTRENVLRRSARRVAGRVTSAPRPRRASGSRTVSSRTAPERSRHPAVRGRKSRKTSRGRADAYPNALRFRIATRKADAGARPDPVGPVLEESTGRHGTARPQAQRSDRPRRPRFMVPPPRPRRPGNTLRCATKPSTPSFERHPPATFRERPSAPTSARIPGETERRAQGRSRGRR